MRKRLFWAFLGVLSLTLTATGSTLLQTDDIPPLTILETDPPQGQELLLDQSIFFYFDQPVKQTSLESALKMETDSGENLSIRMEWVDDLTLAIGPATAWPRDTEITFTITDNATSEAGLAMEEDFSLSLRTVGYLTVAEVIPAPDTTEINTDSAITVIFNRPVVPLVMLEEQGDMPSPLVITPPLEGTGKWLNTSIYIFQPDPALSGSTEYEVSVKGGLTDITGAVLQEDYIWRFTTLQAEVLEVWPYDEATGIALEPMIWARFSQPMDHATTEAAFSLVADGSQTPIEGEFEWVEGSRGFSFTPSQRLELESLYTIALDESIATSESGASLKIGWTSSFTTVPYPAIAQTYPQHRDRNANPYGGFEVVFNTAINPETLEDKFIIEPEPWREYDTYYYEYGNRYTLYYDVEPSTDYTVTILPGIEDPYGNAITETTVIKYTTQSYPSEINLNSPGYVGLYSAYNENTRIFATHRNISRLDLGLYNIEPNTVASMLGSDGYEFRRDFSPSQTDLLREWSINVQSQPNMRRYELLLLSQEGESGISNLQCLGAPLPRLLIGDKGVVSEDDPRPLRVRSLPNLQGEILMELQPGATFTVVDGPICADGYFWWEIRNTGGRVGWAAEGTPEYYFIEVTNRTIEEIDPADYPPLDPGLYYLTMQSPQTGQDYQVEHVALVATANMTLKYSPDQILAWATDLESGEPLAGVPVEFYDMEFGLLGRIETNTEGVALLEIPRMESLYTTLFAIIDTDEHYAFANGDWDSGLSPWNFDMPAEYTPSQWRAYIHTDRALYRPGQPIYFRGIVRLSRDVEYIVPDMGRVPVAINDPTGATIYEAELPLTEFGTFNGEFTLDDEAALGYYSIYIDLTPGDWRGYFNAGIQVAEYVPPEFSVSAEAAQSEVVQGDTIQISGEGRFFSGGPLSNARVEWSALTKGHYFNYQGPGYYSFIDYNYDEGPGEYYGSYGNEVATGTLTSDSEGRFAFELPADLGKATQSQLYTVEIRMIDESDLWVSTRTEVVVHQGQVYVGLAPESYIGKAAEENVITLLTVDWDSQPVAGQTVDYEIVERFWSSVQEEDELGRTVWTWEVEEKPIEDGEGTITTDDEGKARIVFTPPAAGTYKVYARTRDEEGNLVRSSSFIWVSGSDYVAWRQQNSNRFDLIKNADEYKVGDTAEILIASPFQGDTVALVTLERGGILEYDVIELTSNSTVYEIPIKDNFAPNIFVSVLIMKGVDENNPYAEFRMGMTKLVVDTERLALNVEITPDIDMEAGEFAGPGDTVTYTIKTTDWQGKPVSAEVGISVTDLAVLTLDAGDTTTLMEYFYSERGVSVRTSAALSVSVDKATQTILDTIKGGGGGGAESGIFDIREEFVDTPGWEPTLVTNANGIGTYTLTLPDNLTIWRLNARAVTRGNFDPMLVGQTTTDIQSTKPLLLRPLTPRFLVVDDVVQVGAIVNNNSGQDQSVELFIEGTGFELAGDTQLSQTVQIPAGQRQRVNWDIRVLDVDAIDLTFFASGNDGAFTDASKPPSGRIGDRMLPVYNYEVPETVGTAGMLSEEGSRTEAIALPRHLDITQGELTIQVDRSLAGPTIAGLDYLRNYPLQTTESTISRFLPNLYTARALALLDVENEELSQHLETELNFAIQRLYSTQRIDGSWGWTPTTSGDPMVTAYAIIGLSEAQAAGYTIEADVISHAADYLIAAVDKLSREPLPWEANRQAFYLYALSRAGYNRPSAISVLYNMRTRLSTDGLALLAMTIHSINPDDARLPNFISDFTSNVVLSASGAHWEDEPLPQCWTTDTRSTALVLRTLIQIDPENQLIPNIVRWLMVARQGDAWETTQETAWAVIALTDWMVLSQETSPDYTFNIRLNGEEQALEDKTATDGNFTEDETLRIAVADLLAEGANRLTFVRTEGDGNLYYTAHLEAYLPVNEVKAVSQGAIIDRKYYRLTADGEYEQVTEGTVAENIEVVLTIIAPNDLYYVTVEDPIPAGSAAIDANLDTESVFVNGPSLDRPLSQGWGWWWFGRSELRDEKVVMFSQYLPRGTYEYRYTLRLGLPGTFNVIPPTVQETYFPEVYGRGDGSTFVIHPSPTQATD